MIPQTLTLTIPGRPYTAKNNAVMVKGRNLLLPSPKYRKYKAFCVGTKTKPGWLTQYGNYQFTGPVRLDCHYWMRNYQGWPDLVGLLQATCDILEASGILLNDRQVVSFGNSRIVGVDAESPRVQIEIRDIICEWWRW